MREVLCSGGATACLAGAHFLLPFLVIRPFLCREFQVHLHVPASMGNMESERKLPSDRGRAVRGLLCPLAGHVTRLGQDTLETVRCPSKQGAWMLGSPA